MPENSQTQYDPRVRLNVTSDFKQATIEMPNGTELQVGNVVAQTNLVTGVVELSVDAAKVSTLPTVLYDSAVPVSLTGTTIKTALASIVVPAGCMGENSTLRITPVWAYTNSANNKSFGVEIGAAMPGVVVYARTRTTSQSECPLIELQNRGSVSSQISKYSQTGSFSTNQSSANEVFAIDFSQQQTVFVYATLANASDTVTLAALRVEVIGAQ